MRLAITKSVLAIGAVGLAVAGCGGGDEEEAAGGGGAASAGAAIVSVAGVDGTDVLTDSEGRTLYTAEVEKDGNILCVDACTSFWAPVAASAAEAETAAADLDMDLGVVDRPEGEQQLTLDGVPLYTFTEEGAGQLDGDGFTDDFQGTEFVWEAATAGSDSSGSTAPSDDSSNPYGY
jgi:predicted lipoprotein with Yx(FWY)xxD motif